jgi:hypothetical protein
VSDPGHELPDGGHLLPLHELHLGGLQLSIGGLQLVVGAPKLLGPYPNLVLQTTRQILDDLDLFLEVLELPLELLVREHDLFALQVEETLGMVTSASLAQRYPGGDPAREQGNRRRGRDCGRCRPEGERPERDGNRPHASGRRGEPEITAKAGIAPPHLEEAAIVPPGRAGALDDVGPRQAPVHWKSLEVRLPADADPPGCRESRSGVPRKRALVRLTSRPRTHRRGRFGCT